MGKSRRTILGPVSKRPKCVGYLNEFPDGLRVYYPSTQAVNGYGVYVFKKGPGVGIALFTENPDGTINWHPRVIPNKKTGAPMFIYDLVEVQKTIAHEVARAIMKVADEAFGLEDTIHAKHEAKVGPKVEEDETEKLLKKLGSI